MTGIRGKPATESRRWSRLAGSRLDRRLDWAVSGIELQMGAHRCSWRGEVEDVVTEAEDVPGYVGREAIRQVPALALDLQREKREAAQY